MKTMVDLENISSSAENQIVDLREYFDILKRKRKLFAISSGLVFFLALFLTFTWSATYMSQATILIEAQDIPTDLVRSAVTSSASQRIQSITQQVMTRDVLLKLAEKHKLFTDAREEGRSEDILKTMRKRIGIDVVDSNVNNAKGSKDNVAIAFTLSFQHALPEITQLVTSDLADLFLNRNESYRSAKANETLTFLSRESDVQGKKIAVLEAKIALFKEQNQHSLPEMRELNIRTLTDLERQQTEVETQIRTLEERDNNLTGELANIHPWSPMISSTGERVADPSSMLRVLQMQLVNAKAKYSNKHPTIVRLKHEITAMKKQFGTEGLPSTAGVKPDNPAYITLRARLNAVKSELKSLQTLSTQLTEKMDNYKQYIEFAPQVERDFLLLSRNYESALRSYEKTRDSQIDARAMRDREKTNTEEFTLIDPPQIPLDSIRPNRTLFAIIGFLFSLIVGLNTVAFSHYRSQYGKSTNLVVTEENENTEIDNTSETIKFDRRKTDKVSEISHVSDGSSS